METSDILIIILMFAVPIFSAIIDNKKKAKKRAEKAAWQARHPEYFEPINIVEPEDDVEEKVSAPTRQKPFADAVNCEAKATEQANAAPIEEPGKEVAERKKIDVRDMIVYDAIMNPKFKE